MNSSPLIKKDFENRHVKKAEEFILPVDVEETFYNENNSTIYVDISSNKWVSHYYQNPRLVGHYLFIQLVDIAIQGEYFYVISPMGMFHIFDVSNPESPKLLSSTYIDVVQNYQASLTIEGEIAYISEGQSGLFIYDISNKRYPQHINTFFPVYTGWQTLNVRYFEIIGDYGYLLDVVLGLVILDMKNPENIVQLGNNVNGKNGGTLFVYGDVVAVGGRFGTLELFNISSKSNPLPFDNRITTRSSCNKIQIKDDVVYTAFSADGVRIYNLINQSMLDLISDNRDITCNDLYISEEEPIMFVVYGYFLKIYNISNLTKPELLYSLEFVDQVSESIEIHTDGFVYISHGIYGGFSIVNISSVPEGPPERVYNLNSFLNPGLSSHGIAYGVGNNAKGIDIQDDYLYIVDGKDGIKIFDVKTDVRIPLLIGRHKTKRYHNYLSVSGNYAYVSANNYGMLIYDISNKSFPYIFSVFYSSRIQGLFVKDEFAYIIDSNQGLLIVNVSNKTNPVLVGKYEYLSVGSSSIFVEEKQKTAFITDTYVLGGLSILDISNKSLPHLISEIETKNSHDVVVDGDIMFIADGSDGIRIMNISDLKNPKLISEVNTDQANSLRYKDGFLFVADGGNGVIVIDIGNIKYPKKIVHFPGYNVYDVVTKDNMIYVADSYQGLKCIEMDIVLKGNSETFSHFCGETEIKIIAKDNTEEVDVSFSLTKESYCNDRGECLKNYECSCLEGFDGNNCEYWSCDRIDFRNVDAVCNGKGNCISKNTCKCNTGYIGDSCETNIIVRAVVIPLSIVSGVGILMCLGFLFLISLFCCFFCVVIFFMCVVALSVVTLRQTLGLKKYQRLKNFDLLLQEQLLEDDTSIAHLRIRKEFYEINFNEIKIKRQLGSGGSNSIVYLAKWSSKEVAFKSFKSNTLFSSQVTYDEFEKEVQILGSIAHPHIISFYGACIDLPRIGIIMEYCSLGDLDFFLENFKEKNNESYPLNEKIRMVYEISTSLEYLHSRRIIHRDLKLQNVLVDRNENCKLMDFGLSKIVDKASNIKTKRIGTSLYIAPEIISSGGIYNEKVDVFSFSMLIFVVLTENRLPYGSKESTFNIDLRVANDSTLRPSLNELRNVLFEKEEEDYNNSIWDWLVKEIVQFGWDHDPERRPGFHEISILFEKNMKNMKIRRRKDFKKTKRSSDRKKENGYKKMKEEAEEEEEEEEEREEGFQQIKEERDILRKRVVELEQKLREYIKN